MKAVLILEDERVFEGELVGSKDMAAGEVVFNTSMTGYEEIMTDPSYRGQLVTLTYPLIGNYGFNEDFSESRAIHAEGLIIKDYSIHPQHYRQQNNIIDYLQKNKLTGIAGVDTRALTRHIREKGSMYGLIAPARLSFKELQGLLLEKKEQQRKLVNEVTRDTAKIIEGSGPLIVVMDFGVKTNVIRHLKSRGAKIVIVPAFTSADVVLDYEPEGVVLSSGPGDPRDIMGVTEEVEKLIGRVPLMGICLGHQLLGIALGGNTYKMKFGHHGGNHPVKNLETGEIAITTQNHVYALNDNLPSDMNITHINLNDGSVEGLKHRQYPIISLQYHPEAAPGPADSEYIFDEFFKLMQQPGYAKKIAT